MTHKINRIGPLPVKRRLLEVKKVTDLTPSLRRVTLTGSELAGFSSPGADDHVKLFFPAAGETAPQFAEGAPRRDYTPRAYRPEQQELDIDFVLHGEGPGAVWAAQAQPGQRIGIGGPRGSSIVTYDFDWYLLAGDESALPSIARRLEELPAGARVTVLLEVQEPADELPLVTYSDLTLHWLHRGEAAAGHSTLLLDAIQKLPPQTGEGFVWIATESSAAAAIRRHLLEDRKLPSEYVRVVGYWKRGVAGHEESKGGQPSAETPAAGQAT